MRHAPAARPVAVAGVLVFLVSLVSGAADAPASGPRAAADRFYTAYLRHRDDSSLPTGALLERLTPLISERLRGQIIAATESRDRWIARHPPEESPGGGPPVMDKPPLTDGDLFSSLFEGPESHRIGRAVREGDSWRVQVFFRYEGSRWEDAVIVRKDKGRFVVDDVVYGGAGDFNPPGRLSKALADALQQAEADR